MTVSERLNHIRTIGSLTRNDGMPSTATSLASVGKAPGESRGNDCGPIHTMLAHDSTTESDKQRICDCARADGGRR
jgi:hypothetical protein